MKKIIIALAIMAGSANAAPMITQTEFDCEGVHHVVVDYTSITVDGVEEIWTGSAPANVEREDGTTFDSTASSYTGGWIFATGETALSGVLAQDNNFWFCEAQ